MPSSLRFVLLLAIANAALVLSVHTTQENERVVFGDASSFANLPSDWKHTQRANASSQITLIFAIKQRNLPIVSTLLSQVSNPKSPSYGHYLSFEQVGELVRNDQAHAAVHDWLSSHNVSLIDCTVNGEFILATLSVAAAEQMLGDVAEFHVFTNKITKRSVIRSARIALPTHIAAAVDFVERTVSFPPTVTPRFMKFGKAVSAGQPGDAYPAVLQKYYQYDGAVSSSSSSNQSVFEALGQSYSPSDLSTFQSSYAVTSLAVSDVIGPNSPLDCLFNPNDCAEASLDVQYIMGVAQNVPTTFWSIDSTDNTPFLDWAIAVANASAAPLVHSISYGGVESQEDYDTALRFDVEVQKLGLRGITVFVASGDDGVANFPARSDPTQCGFFPSYPATSPHVTVVGATQGPEAGTPEIACTSDTGGLITSGGGFSGYWTMPDYQQQAVKAYFSSSGTVFPPTSMYNTTGRAYPDVSALGHNYEIIINGQVEVGSGTSASTPVFAGMIALINDARMQAGKAPLGFLNPALYSISASNFHDITSGTNNCCAGPNPDCCTYGFECAVGWDPVTGIGSPNYPALKAALLAL